MKQIKHWWISRYVITNPIHYDGLIQCIANHWVYFHLGFSICFSNSCLRKGISLYLGILLIDIYFETKSAAWKRFDKYKISERKKK